MNFKYTTTLGVLMLAAATVFAQDVMEFQSQFGVGSTQIDEGQTIAMDGESTYVFGKFAETMDFDPTAGSLELDPLGSPDLFLIKYNSDNSVEWGFNLGRIALFNGVTAGGLAVDSDGNVYISGSFSSLVDFDPSENSMILTSVGGRDVFLAKYTSDGEFVWAESYGTSTSETSTVLDIDMDDNVVFSLMYTSEIDIDLGGGETILTPVGQSDAVAIKVDSDGGYLWSHVISSSAIDEITEITCSSDGEIAIGAQINGVSNPFFEADMYVAIIDSDEMLLWDYNFDNFEQNNDISAFSFDVDGESIYVGGRIQGTTQFDPANVESPIDPLFTDPFFAKYSLSDGSLIWANYIESEGIEDYLSDLIEAGSALMVTGSFDASAKFDPADFLTEVSSNGGQDIYIAAYDRETGEYITANTSGGSGNEHNSDAQFDGGGIVNITGNYSTSLMLDANSDPIPAVGFNDVFVAKFQYETSLSTNEVNLKDVIGVYPVPTSETLYISSKTALSGNVEVKIINVVGQVVRSTSVSMANSAFKLDVSDLKTGVYILDITLGQNRFSERFVKN